MGKKLDKVYNAVRKYTPIVGSALAKGARGTAKATAIVAGYVGRGIDNGLSFAYRKYASHQETLDALVLYTSAACTTAAVVDDYTNIGFVSGAVVGAAGAG